MSERAFGRVDAFRKSISFVARSIPRIVRGDVVMVPVQRSTFEKRVERLAQADPEGWGSYGFIVDEALNSAPITVGDGRSFEEFHGMPKGSTFGHIWKADEPQLKISTEK